METMIKSALTESVKQYGSIIKEDAQPILEKLYETFDSHEPFLDKVNLMDQVFDDFPKFDELRELRIKDYVLKHTSISEEQYRENLRVEWYMFADTAKSLGVIDKIIGVDCDIDEIL